MSYSSQWLQHLRRIFVLSYNRTINISRNSAHGNATDLGLWPLYTQNLGDSPQAAAAKEAHTLSVISYIRFVICLNSGQRSFIGARSRTFLKLPQILGLFQVKWDNVIALVLYDCYIVLTVGPSSKVGPKCKCVTM